MSQCLRVRHTVDRRRSENVWQRCRHRRTLTHSYASDRGCVQAGPRTKGIRESARAGRTSAGNNTLGSVVIEERT